MFVCSMINSHTVLKESDISNNPIILLKYVVLK